MRRALFALCFKAGIHFYEAGITRLWPPRPPDVCLRCREERFYGCSTVVLIGFTCPAITVATVVLRALVRVRERALDRKHKDLYKNRNFLAGTKLSTFWPAVTAALSPCSPPCGAAGQRSKSIRLQPGWDPGSPGLSWDFGLGTTLRVQLIG